MGQFFLGLFGIFAVVLFVQYKIVLKKAYERLYLYPTKTLSTNYGKMTYIDKGTGETVLISHGIFGGYDQAFESLQKLIGDDYRKIAPSRFGYPGSDLPMKPSPKNQAVAFSNLLDELEIEKTFIMTTSAGSASGLMFVTEYPERVKGLILLSSAVPTSKKKDEEIKGMTGPPAFIINDFFMWFATKYVRCIFKVMFASKVDKSVYETMLPVKLRKEGIKADEKITNIDINFDDYRIAKITAPILVIHAKDDPMTKYMNLEKFILEKNAKTSLFETGGHLISGHGSAVAWAIREFIEEGK